MLEGEPTGHYGRVANGSGQNVIEAEELKSTVSQKSSKVGQRSALNANTKSFAAVASIV